MHTQAATNWLICEITKARLGAVSDMLENSINTNNTNFKDLVLHTARMGGKKLRPSLYLLTLNTGDYYDKDLLIPGTALELIHIASLHHDDVMDRADKRRNTTSVNAKWGNLNATYSGNYLFSKAITILSNFDSVVNQITCNYISDLCLGQIKEAENAFNLKISYEEHIDVLIKKTASLFELPCKLGAILSKANTSTIQALTDFSRHIGIAFQLIDDLLDLKGNHNKTGKVPGTDIKEGVYTYGVLHTLNESTYAREIEDILSIENMSSSDLKRAVKLVTLSGGIEAARTKAIGYINKANDALDMLPETKTKTSLTNLTKFILARDY